MVENALYSGHYCRYIEFLKTQILITFLTKSSYVIIVFGFKTYLKMKNKRYDLVSDDEDDFSSKKSKKSSKKDKIFLPL